MYKFSVQNQKQVFGGYLHMLKKLLPGILTATALLVAPAFLPKLVEAGPKFLGTGKTIQPGQAVSVQVTNNTSESIQVELPSYTGPITMRPRQRLKLSFKLRPKDKGVSFLYWSPQANLPLQAKVAKPNAKTLEVELQPGSYYNDDRAIFDSEFNDTLYIF
ncbi:MAG TPA: hypothetical protein DCY88_31500 [Cyanobacteria bacterium UBA11372]|nr:hypothetical protein [Cyanobacteria bacterium UBA11372]